MKRLASLLTVLALPAILVVITASMINPAVQHARADGGLSSPIAADPTSDAALTVHTDQVIQSEFLGVNAVYHGFAFMDEQVAKGMTDADRTREFGRVISMGLNIARTWYRPDYTCSQSWDDCEWNAIAGTKLYSLYQWLDVMKANNIDVALQAGWWLHDVKPGQWNDLGKPPIPDSSWDAYVKRYARWVTRSITEIVVTKHYTNVKYLMMLTEPTQLSGKPKTEYANVDLWPSYKQTVIAVHEELVSNGLHVDRAANPLGEDSLKIKLVGPNNGGRWWEADNIGASDLANAIVDLDQMLDIYSGHAYDQVYVGWNELCNRMMSKVSSTGKPVWLDEFGHWADMGHEEVVRGTGRYGNYLAQAVAACLNAGVQNVMLWELFDQQYVSPLNWLSNTPDNQDGWYSGIHRWGTCYWPDDTVTETDSITHQTIPISDTTYCRPSWYAFSMMSKYLSGRDGTRVYTGTVYSTTSAVGVYLSAVKRSDGRWSFLVVSGNDFGQQVTVTLRPAFTQATTLHRYLYDPANIVPTEEAKIIGYDRTFTNVTGSFSDWIPAEAVVIYSEVEGQEELPLALHPTITVTSSLNSGPGSLRWAIANLEPGGTIVISDNVDLIPLTSGALVITKSMTINGPGSDQLVVNGLKRDRVFDVKPGAGVVISGLTIADGLAHRLANLPGLSYATWRSANEGGGGIRNAGILTITNSVLRGNEADYGGAIHNDGDGRVAVSNSAFLGNSATSDGGAIANFGNGVVIIDADSVLSTNEAGSGGGGILNWANGIVALSQVTVTNNTARYAGGGIYNGDHGRLTITNSRISNNHTTLTDTLAIDPGGAGIRNDDFGQVAVIESTVYGNSSASYGGGIHNGGGTIGHVGVITITGSTVADNSATQTGGGIFNGGQGIITITKESLLSTNNAGSGGGGILNWANGVVALNQVTVTNNTARYAGGGIYNGDHGRLTLGLVTVSNNTTTLTYTQGTIDPGGAGIRNDDFGHVVLIDSTLEGNHSASYGGGIHNGGGATEHLGAITVTNSTLAGNTAEKDGGGIFNGGMGSVHIVGSTVGGPDPSDANAAISGGGILNWGNGVVVLDQVTVANNTAGYGGGSIAIGDHAIVTVTHSMFSANSAVWQGGSLANWNNATLMVADTVFSNNRTTGEPRYGLHDGGALYTASRATLTDVTLSGNFADRGGGLYNTSILALNNVTFTHNSAYTAGGMFNTGNLMMTNSRFIGNMAQAPGSMATTSGGGMFTDLGQVILINVTFSRNLAFGDGGGLEIGGGDVALADCTFTENTASATVVGGGAGGGMNIVGGSVSLINDTVSGNTASGRSDVRGEGEGGGVHVVSGAVMITSTTVASNTATGTGGGLYGTMDIDSSLVAYNAGADCWGSITSSGYNLDSDNSCNLMATGDITNTDPKLGRLQDNGGSTWTHALLPGSPAIDHIPFGDNGCGTTITTDQRGTSRPQFGGKSNACDIGAFEAALYLTVTNTADNGTGSLRWAIARLDPGGTINFNLPYPNTITLTTSELVIDKAMTINGPGADKLSISGGSGQNRVLSTSGNEVRLRDLAIRDGVRTPGYPGGCGGGIANTGALVLEKVVVTNNGQFWTSGGGVCNNGMLTLTNSTIADNTGERGGGIRNSGRLTVRDSLFGDNRARFTVGGNIYNDSTGNITLSGTLLRGGETSVLNEGRLELTNSTVSGGGHGREPSAVKNEGTGTMQVTFGTIANNEVGIANNGTLTLTSSIVAHNPRGDCSGSIISQGYNLDSDGTCHLTGPGDRSGSDPRLGPLQDNGGPTWTHALLPGSPVIDQIPSGVNSCGTAITTDQRGVSRPQPEGGSCDSGAFELVKDSATTLPGQTSTAYVPPGGVDGAGASAVLSHSAAATGPATVTVAVYTTNPATVNTLDVGGGYVDLRVDNADPNDQLAAKIYYPATIIGVTETNLVLQYFTGSGWAAVRSSGGGDPVKDMTNNLDGTDSGGRFSATFDNTSTPRITDLTGTVFAFTTNAAPTVELGADVTVNEGDTLSRSGSFSDPGSSSWTATVDYGDGSGVQPLILGPGKTFALSHIYADNGVFTIMVTVTDDGNAQGTDGLVVTVNNIAPVVSAITGPVDPFSVNTVISASAAFTDPGVLDTHTAVWDWGDGNTSPGVITETRGSGVVSGSHTYVAAGIYTVALTVTDKDQASGQSVLEPVVVFDPNADVVTGGGWVKDGGAKAHFGFAARYVGPRNTPSGMVLYTYRSGAQFVQVKSRNIQWLVVTGNTAILRGQAQVNGVGNYTFEITAVDNGRPGNKDSLAIKIWRPDGTLLHALPATRLSGGSITVLRSH